MNSTAMQSSIDNDDDVVERMRFESFKLGSASSTHNIKTNHRHARSRSHNLSISSLPFTSSNSIKPTSDTSPDSPTSSHASTASLAAPSSKRGSHHHRRSSVSTRHESADMMGVTVADLPLSLSDDNINLGEKDSVRRRALWALEGKPDNSSFSKVEIPDISTPEINKKFDIPAKPSFPSAVGPALGGTLNNVPAKRDSFSKHIAASSSSKELLHTLVEEDEEEEEKMAECGDSVLATSPLEMSPVESPVGAAVIAALCRSPSRPRPASLNLRPLALNKENLVIAGGTLPTPSSPTRRSGLRSLTLASPPHPSPMNETMNFNTTSTAMKNNRRQSLTVSTVSQTPSILDFEANFGSTSSISSSDFAKRRSIQYRCSTDHAYAQFTLPTPELTPTIDRQGSLTSSSCASISDRPLSETEQHFLYQAHATLVQRISDLERALAASRSQSRPTSNASDFSSHSHVSLTFPHPEEPSDEMLRLIADLKSERDELNKDIEGWRMRVFDLDKQVSLFARRVDLERREAWVARERSGLLEAEKRGLEKSLEAKSLELQEALDMCKATKMECNKVKQECERLEQELRNKQGVDNECEKLRTILDEERKKLKLQNSRPSNVRIPASADYPPSYSRSIAKRDFSFQTVDAESKDVQDLNEIQINLGPVAEEHENPDEDNELCKYEEEDENDYAYGINGGSSASSLEDIVQSAPLRVEAPAVPAHAMEHVQGHDHHNSLIKAWSFAHAAPRASQETEVDKFFGCLEDYDGSASSDDETSVILSSDNRRSLFSQSLLQHDDGDLPPFLLPKHVGFEIPEEKLSLDAVPEENEEEEEEEPEDTFLEDKFVGEEVEGGVIFKFTPPEDSDVSSEVQTPSPGPAQDSLHIFDEEEEQGIVPFKLPKIIAPSTAPPKPISSSLPAKTGDSSSVIQIPIRKYTSPSPSSIPRSVNLRTYTPTKAMPERCVIARTTVNTALITPSTKRGGTIPTFIPQPRGRPVSPISPPGTKAVSQRASKAPSLTKLVTQSSAPSTNTGSTTHRYEDTDVLNSGPASPSGFQAPQSTGQSPMNGTKLTFQSFANLIPSAFSWSPRAAQKVDAPAPVQDFEPPVLQFVHSGNRKVEKRCYVSKEKQLEKLRGFLAEQQRVRRNGVD